MRMHARRSARKGVGRARRTSISDRSFDPLLDFGEQVVVRLSQDLMHVFLNSFDIISILTCSGRLWGRGSLARWAEARCARGRRDAELGLAGLGLPTWRWLRRCRDSGHRALSACGRCSSGWRPGVRRPVVGAPAGGRRQRRADRPRATWLGGAGVARRREGQSPCGVQQPVAQRLGFAGGRFAVQA
jgi:hypothetical protein